MLRAVFAIVLNAVELFQVISRKLFRHDQLKEIYVGLSRFELLFGDGVSLLNKN